MASRGKNITKRKHQEPEYDKEKSSSRNPKLAMLKSSTPDASICKMSHLFKIVTFMGIMTMGIIYSDLSLTFTNIIPHFQNCDLPIVYSIIFDAGSTGSRVHVFSFYNDSGNFLLHKEVFKDVEPGLSSYASEPKKAAESLISLLEVAKKSIPESDWSKTPISVYATAGLRLLPEKSSTAILNEVSKLLRMYPFHVSKNVVSIMDGKDEAIFGWLTVNFLLGRLQNFENTVALMDLGGGSTQLTFMASSSKTINDHSNDIKNLYYKNRNITLYAKSYLGFGLMEARCEALGCSKDDYKTAQSEGKNFELPIKTPCFVDDDSNKWSHRGVNYRIQGHNESIDHNFESCFILILPMCYTVFKPQELKNMELYAVSYFYDRAVDSNLINSTEGGVVPLINFHDKAKEYCSKKHFGSSFLCLDLTYITGLLWKGYGIDGLKEINLYKQINGIETSWCLGAALIELSNN